MYTYVLTHGKVAKILLIYIYILTYLKNKIICSQSVEQQSPDKQIAPKLIVPS